jgi:Raf kinase inhibitor-like YbhB/YbcL family protein
VVRRLAVLIVLLAVASCGGGKAVSSDAPTSLQVTSTAFADGRPIPQKYSCHAENVSPPLAWAGVPTGTREVALVVDDPDAPNGTYTHWILFGLAPSTTSLEEGVVPAGAKQAKNSSGDAAYAGPCPPSGTHHYRFTVYAFDEPLSLAGGADTDTALSSIGDNAVAQGRLTGTFAAG